MWWVLQSGPVIIVVEVERGLGASCFVLDLLGKRSPAAHKKKGPKSLINT